MWWSLETKSTCFCSLSNFKVDNNYIALNRDNGAIQVPFELNIANDFIIKNCRKYNHWNDVSDEYTVYSV